MAKFEIGAHAVGFDDQKRVLMGHRRDLDLWDLPGGGMDPGELPNEAVVRETKEETGLDVEVERLSIIAVTPEQELGFTFRCRIAGGRMRMTDESDAVRFFAPSKLPANLSPRKRSAIEIALRNPKEIVYWHVNVPSGRQWLAEQKKENL